MCSRIQCVLKKRTKKKGEVSEREREKKNKLSSPISIHRRREAEKIDTARRKKRTSKKYWWGIIII
jgi:hypothetical protein